MWDTAGTRRALLSRTARGQEQRTRFVPATVYDNLHIDRGYVRKLEGNVGWKRRAYLLGDWDIAAGQYFTSWRHDRHVVPGFEIPAGWWSWLAMDYGYRHPTVFVLLVEDGDGMLYVVDEHVQDGWLPPRHADAVRSMLSRHGMGEETLAGVPAGQDVFSKTGENTIAEQYEAAGVYLEPADVDRINGAARLAELLGDPDNGIEPRIQFFERCRRTIETIPLMQHDPRRPEDVLKVDVGEDGQGGDDCLRRAAIRGDDAYTPRNLGVERGAGGRAGNGRPGRILTGEQKGPKVGTLVEYDHTTPRNDSRNRLQPGCAGR